MHVRCFTKKWDKNCSKQLKQWIVLCAHFQLEFRYYFCIVLSISLPLTGLNYSYNIRIHSQLLSALLHSFHSREKKNRCTKNFRLCVAKLFAIRVFLICWFVFNFSQTKFYMCFILACCQTRSRREFPDFVTKRQRSRKTKKKKIMNVVLLNAK